ncbi:MAG: hypothetical protein IT210_25790 [Armatimonadetes bacterium]|nr:hypothetical protein [Armatimonadota bacterium]
MLWAIVGMAVLVVAGVAAGVWKLIDSYGKAQPARLQAKRLLEEADPLRGLDGAVPDLEWFERARLAIISAACAPPMNITDRPGREEFPRYLEALERVASGRG